MSYLSHKTYDKEFKRETVHLVIEKGRKASEVERNLGIARALRKEESVITKYEYVVFGVALK